MDKICETHSLNNSELLRMGLWAMFDKYMELNQTLIEDEQFIYKMPEQKIEEVVIKVLKEMVLI